MMSRNGIFSRALIKDNPILVHLLGISPAIAFTTTATNGLVMGLSALTVLLLSNFVISLLGNYIPRQIRIPAFIIVIASIVTALDLAVQAFLPSLASILAIFMPLIAVNCIVLARAEIFASKNAPLASVIDGLGTGLGFALVLTLLGIFRELLGKGSVFGLDLFGEYFSLPIFIMPCGALLLLGFLAALFQKINRIASKREKEGNR